MSKKLILNNSLKKKLRVSILGEYTLCLIIIIIITVMHVSAKEFNRNKRWTLLQGVSYCYYTDGVTMTVAKICISCRDQYFLFNIFFINVWIAYTNIWHQCVWSTVILTYQLIHNNIIKYVFYSTILYYRCKI